MSDRGYLPEFIIGVISCIIIVHIADKLARMNIVDHLNVGTALFIFVVVSTLLEGIVKIVSRKKFDPYAPVTYTFGMVVSLLLFYA